MVKELLDGKKLDLPPSQGYRTFKKAPKAKGAGAEGPTLATPSLAPPSSRFYAEGELVHQVIVKKP